MPAPVPCDHVNPWVASGQRTADEEASRLWRLLDHIEECWTEPDEYEPATAVGTLVHLHERLQRIAELLASRFE